jgi:molecular chaperone GrpE (heat shock protein)
VEVETSIAGEFASAMQQLSAEAEQLLPEGSKASRNTNAAMATLLAQIVREFYNLNARIQSIETVIVNKLEELAGPRSTSELFDFARQFKKLDTQMDSLRRADGVNQRLFDSMHQELKDYRDNFLRDSLQKPYIRDLLLLFDDLTALSSQLKSAGKNEAKRTAFRQWSDNLENTIHALIEILHRLEVTEVLSQEKVDLKLHKVVSYEPTDIPEEDGQIVMRVKRGFLWREGVLRPEEVIAKRYG